MKKICFAGLFLVTVSSAHAQSSVTLYGLVDSGIEYMSGLKNAAGTGSTSRVQIESGNWNVSVWGLKGSEDIGDGTKVVFQLEGGFDSNSGTLATPGTLFDRWADVGIQSDAYGTFLVGRQMQIANDVYDFDPFSFSAWGAASLTRGRDWNYSSNNISWQSPKWAGFDIHTQYSFSNATNFNGNGTTNQGRGLGVALTYTSALFQVRGIYDETRDPANGTTDDVFNFSREYFAGVNVFLGPVKLTADYQASHSQGSVAADNGITTLQHEWAGIVYQATSAISLIGAAYHVNANNGGGNATFYSVGGSYSLSKRTILDVQAALVRNSKTGTFSFETQPADYADNPVPGHAQAGVYFGIDHSF
jgi:predicted porin